MEGAEAGRAMWREGLGGVGVLCFACAIGKPHIYTVCFACAVDEVDALVEAGGHVCGRLGMVLQHMCVRGERISVKGLGLRGFRI